MYIYVYMYMYMYIHMQYTQLFMSWRVLKMQTHLQDALCSTAFSYSNDMSKDKPVKTIAATLHSPHNI